VSLPGLVFYESAAPRIPLYVTCLGDCGPHTETEHRAPSATVAHRRYVHRKHVYLLPHFPPGVPWHS